MAELSSNSKRLAKNTLLLYVRTLLTLFIGLFTSRIVLDTLGVEDYGIYNIVGGFVSLFSIVGGSLVGATQRFLNYELGKKSENRSREVFGVALGIHAGLAIVLLVLFETLGLWFLNVKLNIPDGRMYAANWVFQCSLLTFLVNILSSPYNASIIAHERMGAFAYISLLDVFLKLLIVYSLYYASFDRLVEYAVLIVFESLLIRFVYSAYCTRNFPETKFHISRNVKLYKEMTGFASMTFLGQFASVLANQGGNIILNIFFGVAVNASRGISVQVNSAVMKFITDFTTALNPQITKRYASGDSQGMMRLCCMGSKISYFLLLLFAVPIIFRTPYILDLWLKKYPVESVIFVRLTMVLSMVNVLSYTLITGILSTGNIKGMCLWIGGIHILVLPLCYLVLYFGGEAYTVYVVSIIIESILLMVRLTILSKLIGYNSSIYLKDVVFRVVAITILSGLIAYEVNRYFDMTFVGLIFVTIISILSSLLLILIIGFSNHERKIIGNLLVKKFSRKSIV